MGTNRLIAVILLLSAACLFGAAPTLYIPWTSLRGTNGLTITTNPSTGIVIFNPRAFTNDAGFSNRVLQLAATLSTGDLLPSSPYNSVGGAALPWSNVVAQSFVSTKTGAEPQISLISTGSPLGVADSQLYITYTPTVTQTGATHSGISVLMNATYTGHGGDLNGSVNNVSLSGGSSRYVMAVQNDIRVAGGTATNAIGSYVDGSFTGGRTENASGALVVAGVLANTIVDTWIGFEYRPMQIAASPTAMVSNIYGIKIGGVSGASNANYALHTAEGRTHFGGLLDLDQTWVAGQTTNNLISAKVVDSQEGANFIRFEGGVSGNTELFTVNTAGDISKMRNLTLDGAVIGTDVHSSAGVLSLYSAAHLSLGALGNAVKWYIDTGGQFYPATDNSFPIGVTGNRPGSILVGTGGITNAGITVSAGYSSTATATNVTFSAVGVTNTHAVNLVVMGFTGVSVTKKDASGNSWLLGTITAPIEIVLKPGGALVGTSCATAGTQDW